MAQHTHLDLPALFNGAIQERDPFLHLAERVAFLTLPGIDPNPGIQATIKNTSILDVQPANSFGSSAVKGLTASLNQTLNPPGVKFFRLATDPSLDISESQQAQLDSFFRKEERRIVAWLSRHNFTAFTDVAIERVLIEGTEGIRIDPEEGFTLFKTKNLAVNRRGNKVFWAIFQGFVDKPIPDNGPAQETAKRIFTYVNYVTGEIWVQAEDEKEPVQFAGDVVDSETGEVTKLEGDNPKFWFIINTEIPQFNNYAKSFYMNHLSLLEEIEHSALALKNAKQIAGHFFYTMSPTGIGEITPQRFSRIKNNEVVVMDHDKVRPWTVDGKIRDWEWVDRKLQQDGQRLLNLSAVGIFARRAGVKTATEIRAIRAELETLIGSTANILAQTFHFSVIEALIEVLGIRRRLGEDPALEGVEQSVIDKLVRGLVVTGSPEVARERELERLQDATEHSLALFGERAVAQLNIRGYMETVYDSLGINTDSVLREEQEVEAEAQARQQALEQAQQPQSLPGANGQLNQAPQQLADLRAGGTL